VAGTILVVRVKTRDGGAFVVLEIDQDGAAVQIDGQKIAVGVPGDYQSTAIKAEPGRHTLRISKVGFEDFTDEIELNMGKSAPIRVTLQRSNPLPVPRVQASAVLEIDPAGAAVRVDGPTAGVQVIGDGKQVEVKGEPGLCKVRISKGGFEALTREIELQTVQSPPIKVALEPIKPQNEAAVVLEIDQPGAAVRVDGQKVAVTVPGSNRPIEVKTKPGRHVVQVSKEGFKACTDEIEVKTAKSGPIKVLLQPVQPLPPVEAVVVLEIDQAGAEVQVDGQKVAVAVPGSYKPIEVKAKPGRHAIQVARDGFTAFTAAVELKEGKSEPIRVRLQPKRPEPLDCTRPEGVRPADVRWAQEAWARYLGRKVEETIEVADGVAMTFVLVPPGKFRMGSPKSEDERTAEEVLHEVTLTEPFDLGKTEVTQAQYKALGLANPSFFKGDNRPVEMVSWIDARNWADKLTEKRGDQHQYRLPAEAEWEYACRGGRSSSQPFGVGDGHELASHQANFPGNMPYGGAEKGPNLGETCRVARYEPNALGLHDMHGNVWEWCRDRYGPYPRDAVVNPTGPQNGAVLAVLRGGGWSSIARCCRAANRAGLAPTGRLDGLGFRLARSVPSGNK
jgi:formylglycine-generating enzyme required for sulfatase activity